MPVVHQQVPATVRPQFRANGGRVERADKESPNRLDEDPDAQHEVDPLWQRPLAPCAAGHKDWPMRNLDLDASCG
jgi:hypothetical protein